MQTFTTQIVFEVLYTATDIPAESKEHAIAICTDRVECAMRRLSTEYNGLFNAHVMQVLKPERSSINKSHFLNEGPKE